MERCKNVFEAILKYGHDEDWLPDFQVDFDSTDAAAGSPGKDRYPPQAAGARLAAVAQRRPLRLQRPDGRDPPARVHVSDRPQLKKIERALPKKQCPFFA